jgi:hypothetical protein
MMDCDLKRRLTVIKMSNKNINDTMGCIIRINAPFVSKEVEVSHIGCFAFQGKNR